MITLKTLPQATEQEVFNQVAVHLLTQNDKSFIDGGCAYRGDNNLKCAAGCLIADDEYDEKMEDLDWYNMTLYGHAPKEHRSIIHRLQKVHDNYHPREWKQLLKGVAHAHGLTMPNIPQKD